ncbi:MAG: amidohydrolase [Candidatus Rokuibacteriota bacterium]|nr:MAG: amidohydrolase [Candidatus Rokubacteria bacterium]
MAQDRVIDMDGHITEPVDLWLRYVDAPYRDMAPRIVQAASGADVVAFMGSEHVPAYPIGLPGAGMAGQRVGPRTMFERRYVDGHRGGFDPSARLEVMDAEGIDAVLLFPTLSSVPIAAIPDEGFGLALARGYNNWLTEFCQTAPDRLFGVAQVPLLHVDAAIAESTRAIVELQMKAIFLRPNPYAGRAWTDPIYDPFWICVQDLGVPIAFHEGTFPRGMLTAGIDRFESFFFQHIVSHPFEQQLACLSLIAGGVLERFPRLRVAFMESGTGWLPYWLHRMDEHYETLGWMVPEITMLPSNYFSRQCYISTEPGDSHVAGVAELIGADRILFASDFPHYDAVFPGAVQAFVANCGLDSDGRRAILSGNAARLLGID